MSSRRHIVISSDCHAGPRKAADYRPYVDPDYRGEFDAYVERERRTTRNLFGAEVETTSGAGDEAFRARRIASLKALGVPDELAELNVETHYRSEASIEGAWDSTARLAALEAEGIVAEVIHPDGVFGSRLPFRSFGQPAIPELEAAGKRAFNRWLADLCADQPARRAGIIQIALHDVDEALREIEHGVKSGLTGGVGLPGLQAGSGLPGYNDARYEPIWAMCEEMGLALTHHGGTAMADAQLYGTDPYQVAALNSVETGFVSRRPFLFLMFGGVFDRHPKLKLVITENFADWVPSMLRHLDSHVEQFWMSGIRGRLALRPSEYWHRHCHLGASFLSRYEAELLPEIGVENVLWGADYPHIEGTHPYTRESLRATFCGVPEADVRKTLSENAARVYDFDLEALRPFAEQVGPSIEDLSVPFALQDRPRDYIGSGFRS
jgi:predicted TIM-barrel fold metal-dependent hydrolase